MKRSAASILIFILLLGFVASQSIFYVSETQRGLVLQLGEPMLPVRTPGLNFKLPFIQTAVLMENRILTFVIPKTLSLSSDMKPFEIDNYACWRIVDPLLFVKTLRTESVATERLKNIVYSQLRAAIGSETLKNVVDTNRTVIMKNVLEKSNQQASAYGVTIIDVRIKRSDLPNRKAIFDRMNADRSKMANQYRAEGESSKREINSKAERETAETIAKAQKESTIIRGAADAKAAAIFAEALATAPEFYEFTKSLDVYKKSFTKNSKVIFAADDPLLQYFH